MNFGTINRALTPLISTFRCGVNLQQWRTTCYTSCYMKLINQFLQQTNSTPRLPSNVYTAVKALGIKCRRGTRAGQIVRERRANTPTQRQITVRINNERRSAQNNNSRVLGNCI